MNEIWRSVKDYEGLYEVSNWGRVRNCRTGCVLRPGKHRDGYLQVNLYKDGVMKRCYVHRLVATAFIPNPDNLPQINHKDENKENNRIENLEWCNCKYNNNYGTHIEKISKKVYMYNLEDGLCGLWPSTIECERNGFSSGNIANCCNGKYKKYKGFKWSYDPPKPPKALPYYVGVLPCGPSGQGD